MVEDHITLLPIIYFTLLHGFPSSQSKFLYSFFKKRKKLYFSEFVYLYNDTKVITELYF